MKAKYILLRFLSKVVIKISVSHPICSLPANPQMLADSCLCSPLSPPSISCCVSFLSFTHYFTSFSSLTVLSSLPLIYIYILDPSFFNTHTHTSAYCAWCGFLKVLHKLSKNIVGSNCPVVLGGLQNFMFSVSVSSRPPSRFSHVQVFSVFPSRD